MSHRAPTWPDLLLRIQQLRDSGTQIRDSDGAVIRSGSRSPRVPFVRIFPRGTIDKLEAWLREAKTLLLAGNCLAALQQVDRLLAVSAATSLSSSGDLSLASFAPSQSFDEDGSFDNLAAWEGLDLLLHDLCDEAEDMSAAQAISELPDREFWTLTDLAGYLRVRRKKIIENVSRYRRENGKLPIWACREPGKQRGFRIHWPTYKTMMRSGDERSPAFRRAIK